MKELWIKLETWAKANAKRTLGLRAGATKAQIAAAEHAMGLTFPADYRESLLVHDGQEGDEESLFRWLPGCSPLKPLAEVVKRWNQEKELAAEYPPENTRVEGPLQTYLWHARRIPIAGTDEWDGDNTYVDLIPSSAGTDGQIVSFVSECDLVCLGSGLRAALERYVAALESGDWVFHNDKQDVTPKGEAADDYPNESDEWAQYLVRPAKKSAAKPAAPAKKSTKPAAPAKQSAAKPAKKPVKQPAKKPFKKPVAKPKKLVKKRR